MKKHPFAVAIAAVALVACLFAFLRPHEVSAPPAGRSARGATQTDDEAPSRRDTRFESAPSETSAALGEAPAPGATRVRLEGQVIDDEDLAVPGATVVLGSEPPVVVVTQADGIFHFDGLHEGTFDLFARTDALAAGPLSVAVTAAMGPITLRMGPAGKVLVRVVDDAGGAELAGAQIELLDGSGLVVTGDDHGLVTVTGLSRGGHPAHVTRRGYAPATIALAASTATAATPTEVRLLAGATVQGDVRDERGALIAGARVRLDSVGVSFHGQVAFGPEAVTDAKGRFTFDAIAAGPARFVAEDVERGMGAASVVVDPRGTADASIRLRRGRGLHGHVVDPSGLPLPLAMVRVAGSESGRGLSSARGVRADAHGEFRITGLGGGTARVVATLEARSSEVAEVDLSRGDGEVTLRIDGSATIDGIVLTAAGEPVSDAQVAASPEPNGKPSAAASEGLLAVATAVSDAGGRFSLRGLANGTYRVRASDGPPVEAASFWMRPSKLAEAGAKNVKLVVEDGGTLRGRVVYKNGDAPKSFLATVTTAQPITASSADGTFEIPRVPSGAQTLTISGPNIDPRFLESVVVAQGKVTDVGTIEVDPLRTLRGSVVRQDGSPVAGATVTIGATLLGDGARILPETDGSRGVTRLTTAADGTFVFASAARILLFAVASDDTYGTSPAVPVPASGEDPIVLTVAPGGSLSGTVSRQGSPLQGVIVVATTAATNRCRFVATTADDGTYSFAGLAAGTYVVTASYSPDSAHTTQAAATTTIATSVAQKLDLQIPAGPASVNVVLQATRKPFAAQTWLLSGTVSADSAGTLETAVAERGAGTTYMITTAGAGPYAFDGVEPGSYSVCVTAIFDDLTNPATSLAVQRQAALLPTRCVPVSVGTGAQVAQVAL